MRQSGGENEVRPNQNECESDNSRGFLPVLGSGANRVDHVHGGDHRNAVEPISDDGLKHLKSLDHLIRHKSPIYRHPILSHCRRLLSDPFFTFLLGLLAAGLFFLRLINLQF